ncbi:(deoxy)nucleoside triphosphate pyrophosphohydrolase [Anaerorhabdus sp.]|uniref:(deoxy)nucleoside triphosphate pyrophosphohydrolase n=1 Tax=Anaerorhabdus sp. TaxID=1872524 RepID=UPI002FC99054
MKEIHVVAAIIEEDNKILIAKRSNGEFKGMWEFPGGKVESGETNQQALIREIREELSLDINVLDLLIHVDHQYPSFLLHMDCYLCSTTSNEITLHDHTETKWINSFDAINIEWVPADITVINEYRRLKHD